MCARRGGGNRIARALGRAWLWTGLAAILLLAPAPSVQANGGKLQVGNRQAGPFELTVFTDPTPIRVGTVDVSVAVQRAGTSDFVPDARVTVGTQPLGLAAPGGTFAATHERATNKLFYAADVILPAAGRWLIAVQVASELGEGSVSFEVEATEPSLLDDPLVVMLFAAPPLLLILWWVARTRRRQRP